MLEKREADLNLMFQVGQGWEFASMEELANGNILPNKIAYHESSATIALILTRSSGGDFALGEPGLLYLEEARSRNDGRPIHQAFVVYADVGSQTDLSKANMLYLLKLVSFETPQEARLRINGQPPKPGKFPGTQYWWMKAPSTGKFSW